MNSDPKLRPLYLAQILYERTDEDHYLTTAELMEILEKEHGFKVHRQTIPADVAALRSFGMEIQEVMSSQKRYNLISREYDIAEIKLLIDAVESSKFITKKKSEELVAKLSKMAGRNQSEQLKRNISTEDRIKYDNESIYLIIDSINQQLDLRDVILAADQVIALLRGHHFLDLHAKRAQCSDIGRNRLPMDLEAVLLFENLH